MPLSTLLKTENAIKRNKLLLRFLMHRVLFAELAVLLKLDSVGIVFLVLHIVVIALFAFRASKRNLISGRICHGSAS